MASYTRKELIAASRRAYGEGDMDRAKRFAQMARDVPDSTATSTLGQAGQAADDMARIFADSVTRGFADKTLGDEDAMKTRESRERAGWAGVPADLAGALAGSPYHVAGKGMGAVIGAAEGALNEYGHQDNWVPGLDDLKDIGRAGLVGSGLGAVGQKAGDIVSGLYDRMFRNKLKGEQPFKTDAELSDAMYKSMLEDPKSMRSQDLFARANRAKQVRTAQGGDRGSFAKMVEGIEGIKPDEVGNIGWTSSVMNPKNIVRNIGKAADFTPTKYIGPAAVMGDVMMGNIPVTSVAALAAKEGTSRLGSTPWANKITDGEVENLMAAIRDPRGVGLHDPAIANIWRDRLSKLAVAGGKSPTFGGPR